MKELTAMNISDLWCDDFCLIRRNKKNKFSKLTKHKKIQKKRYLSHLCDREYGGSILLMECLRKDGELSWYKRFRNDGFEYWQEAYISSKRKYAKRRTNQTIRAKYRNTLHQFDEEMLDDIYALTGSDYEKIYDYYWTIW